MAYRNGQRVNPFQNRFSGIDNGWLTGHLKEITWNPRLAPGGAGIVCLVSSWPFAVRFPPDLLLGKKNARAGNFFLDKAQYFVVYFNLSTTYGVRGFGPPRPVSTSDGRIWSKPPAPRGLSSRRPLIFFWAHLSDHRFMGCLRLSLTSLQQ